MEEDTCGALNSCNYYGGPDANAQKSRSSSSPTTSDDPDLCPNAASQQNEDDASSHSSNEGQETSTGHMSADEALSAGKMDEISISSDPSRLPADTDMSDAALAQAVLQLRSLSSSLSSTERNRIGIQQEEAGLPADIYDLLMEQSNRDESRWAECTSKPSSKSDLSETVLSSAVSVVRTSESLHDSKSESSNVLPNTPLSSTSSETSAEAASDLDGMLPQLIYQSDSLSEDKTRQLQKETPIHAAQCDNYSEMSHETVPALMLNIPKPSMPSQFSTSARQCSSSAVKAQNVPASTSGTSQLLSSQNSATASVVDPPPVKRKRGRPFKNEQNRSLSESKKQSAVLDKSAKRQQKRKATPSSVPVEPSAHRVGQVADAALRLDQVASSRSPDSGIVSINGSPADQESPPSPVSVAGRVSFEPCANSDLEGPPVLENMNEMGCCDRTCDFSIDHPVLEPAVTNVATHQSSTHLNTSSSASHPHRDHCSGGFRCSVGCSSQLTVAKRKYTKSKSPAKGVSSSKLKRPVGRPRKNPLPEPQPKKQRGRPKGSRNKKKPVAAIDAGKNESMYKTDAQAMSFNGSDYWGFVNSYQSISAVNLNSIQSSFGKFMVPPKIDANQTATPGLLLNSAAPPVKRKPGRPRKNPLPSLLPAVSSSRLLIATQTQSLSVAVPRGLQSQASAPSVDSCSSTSSMGPPVLSPVSSPVCSVQDTRFPFAAQSQWPTLNSDTFQNHQPSFSDMTLGGKSKTTKARKRSSKKNTLEDSINKSGPSMGFLKTGLASNQMGSSLFSAPGLADYGGFGMSSSQSTGLAATTMLALTSLEQDVSSINTLEKARSSNATQIGLNDTTIADISLNMTQDISLSSKHKKKKKQKHLKSKHKNIVDPVFLADIETLTSSIMSLKISDPNLDSTESNLPASSQLCSMSSPSSSQSVHSRHNFLHHPVTTQFSVEKDKTVGDIYSKLPDLLNSDSDDGSQQPVSLKSTSSRETSKSLDPSSAISLVLKKGKRGRPRKKKRHVKAVDAQPCTTNEVMKEAEDVPAKLTLQSPTRSKTSPVQAAKQLDIDVDGDDCDRRLMSCTFTEDSSLDSDSEQEFGVFSPPQSKMTPRKSTNSQSPKLAHSPAKDSRSHLDKEEKKSKSTKESGSKHEQTSSKRRSDESIAKEHTPKKSSEQRSKKHEQSSPDRYCDSSKKSLDKSPSRSSEKSKKSSEKVSGKSPESCKKSAKSPGKSADVRRRSHNKSPSKSVEKSPKVAESSKKSSEKSPDKYGENMKKAADKCKKKKKKSSKSSTHTCDENSVSHSSKKSSKKHKKKSKRKGEGHSREGKGGTKEANAGTNCVGVSTETSTFEGGRAIQTDSEIQVDMDCGKRKPTKVDIGIQVEPEETMGGLDSDQPHSHCSEVGIQASQCVNPLQPLQIQVDFGAGASNANSYRVGYDRSTLLLQRKISPAVGHGLYHTVSTSPKSPLLLVATTSTGCSNSTNNSSPTNSESVDNHTDSPHKTPSSMPVISPQERSSSPRKTPTSLPPILEQEMCSPEKTSPTLSSSPSEPSPTSIPAFSSPSTIPTTSPPKVVSPQQEQSVSATTPQPKNRNSSPQKTPTPTLLSPPPNALLAVPIVSPQSSAVHNAISSLTSPRATLTMIPVVTPHKMILPCSLQNTISPLTSLPAIPLQSAFISPPVTTTTVSSPQTSLTTVESCSMPIISTQSTSPMLSSPITSISSPLSQTHRTDIAQRKPSPARCSVSPAEVPNQTASQSTLSVQACISNGPHSSSTVDQSSCSEHSPTDTANKSSVLDDTLKVTSPLVENCMLVSPINSTSLENHHPTATESPSVSENQSVLPTDNSLPLESCPVAAAESATTCENQPPSDAEMSMSLEYPPPNTIESATCLEDCSSSMAMADQTTHGCDKALHSATHNSELSVTDSTAKDSELVNGAPITAQVPTSLEPMVDEPMADGVDATPFVGNGAESENLVQPPMSVLVTLPLLITPISPPATTYAHAGDATVNTEVTFSNDQNSHVGETSAVESDHVSVNPESAGTTCPLVVSPILEEGSAEVSPLNGSASSSAEEEKHEPEPECVIVDSEHDVIIVDDDDDDDDDEEEKICDESCVEMPRPTKHWNEGHHDSSMSDASHSQSDSEQLTDGSVLQTPISSKLARKRAKHRGLKGKVDLWSGDHRSDSECVVVVDRLNEKELRRHLPYYSDSDDFSTSKSHTKFHTQIRTAKNKRRNSDPEWCQSELSLSRVLEQSSIDPEQLPEADQPIEDSSLLDDSLGTSAADLDTTTEDIGAYTNSDFDPLPVPSSGSKSRKRRRKPLQDDMGYSRPRKKRRRKKHNKSCDTTFESGTDDNHNRDSSFMECSEVETTEEAAFVAPSSPVPSSRMSQHPPSSTQNLPGLQPPKKRYQKAGLYSSTYKEENMPKSKHGRGKCMSYVPSEHGHGLLPPPMHVGRYMREKRIDFKLPYEIWWLYTHDMLQPHKMPSPKYRKIKSNIYVDAKPVCRDWEPHACNCTPPTNEQEMGCADTCLNRMVYTECDPATCPCGTRCSNQCMQQHSWIAHLEKITTPDRGYGVICQDYIHAGQMISEYIGEVVSVEEFRRRMTDDYSTASHHYCLQLDAGTVIDGYRAGNITRFVNHSCQPNCEMQKWNVNGVYRIALFSLVDLTPGTELTYDYNFHCFNMEAQQICKCGSENCRGVVGGRGQRVNGQNGSSKCSSKAKDKRKSVSKTRKNKEEDCEMKQATPVKPMSHRERCFAQKHAIFLLRNIHKVKQLRQPVNSWGNSRPPANSNAGVFMTQYSALKTTRSVRTRGLALAEEHVEVIRVAQLAQLLTHIYTTLTNHKDENGIAPAEPLMHVPPKRRNPDYYQLIESPIDLTTIERNIVSGHYHSLEAFDADLNLLFRNVELYCGKKSEIGLGVSRLRKVYSDTMEQKSGELEEVLGPDNCSLTAISNCKPPTPAPQNTTESQETNTVEEVEVGGDEEVIRCICNIYRDEGVMIQCEKCEMWQHSDCMGVGTDVENYQCERCLPRPFSPEVLMIPQPADSLPGCVYYLTLLQADSTQIRVGDCVYILRESDDSTQTRDIFRVERLWKNESDEKFAFGHYYVRPQETFHEPSRKFFTNEVFRVPIYEIVPLETVVGSCCVMDLPTFCKGRPKGAQEEHVYVCEYRLDKTSHFFYKIVRTKWPINTKRYCFDHFERRLQPKRTYSPHEVPEQYKRRESENRSKSPAQTSRPHEVDDTDDNLPLSAVKAIKLDEKKARVNGIMDRLLTSLTTSEPRLDLSYLLQPPVDPDN